MNKKELPPVKPARLGKPLGFDVMFPINVLRQEKMTPSEIVKKLTKKEMK